jgi:hypothetical protein
VVHVGDAAANPVKRLKRRRRIWVQHVAVETDKLRLRLRAAQARGDLDASQEVIAQGIYAFLDKARDAAFRDDPVPHRWANWWRGTLVESAYRNLHAARAQMVDLYDRNQLRAEIPLVVARANTVLHRDDPRRISIEDLEAESVESLRPRMRRVIADSYEQLDLEHAQLRSFRNILYLAAFFVVAAVAVTLVVVSRKPALMPLCFPNELTNAQTGASTVQGLNCPTGSGLKAAQAADVLVVALLGALGGALAATLSIRNLKGTSTAYDVPVALAILKIPLGALTALLALVAIQGKFVPGLSALDSQGQILAYALIFGFAQQALSRLLDRQAQNLLEGLPGGTATEPAPPASGKLQQPPAGTETVGQPVQQDGGTALAETPVGTATTTVDAEAADRTATAKATGDLTVGPAGSGGDVVEDLAGKEPGGPGDPSEDLGGQEAAGASEATTTLTQAQTAAEAAEKPEGDAGQSAGDRPAEEPENASQEDQYRLLRETGNERRDMTEQEEAGLLQEVFGPPDEKGIYGAPPIEEKP